MNRLSQPVDFCEEPDDQRPEPTDEHRTQAEAEITSDMDLLAERLCESAYLAEFASELYAKSDKFRDEVLIYLADKIDERSQEIADAAAEQSRIEARENAYD